MKHINLALQGGGSHGAFTWGVLDALLADKRLHIDGISGTSAGAVNAVALAHGLAFAQRNGSDPSEEARAALRRVWEKVQALGRLGTMQEKLSGMLWGAWPNTLASIGRTASAIGGAVSPYQTNPLDINPLRDLLEREIDFDLIAEFNGPKVFVSATCVSTGKAEIFHGRRLSAKAVMASACLPMLFQAVEIDGRDYWDGGYVGNPALSPLIRQCESSDILLVQINPQHAETPRTADAIIDRVNDLTFNASLLAQMRTIGFINQLLADGHLKPDGFKTVLLHRIEGGAAMRSLAPATKVSTDPRVIQTLFTLGRDSAGLWLDENYASLGGQSTIDPVRDYGDSMSLLVA